MALENAHLTLNPEKCEISKSTLKFFGHIFSNKGMRPDPEKVQALVDAPTPTSASAIRSFLGMASYCTRYIQDFASVSTPLTLLTGKDRDFQWTAECEEAFQEIKRHISSALCMAY
ncbi:uncharacterized protein [Ambystoma mexicanum]|uniref:uncharacterized protein n=1 Tax=Ambystoma mexicanum TaxID=8296 RepID=UPI0037E87341